LRAGNAKQALPVGYHTHAEIRQRERESQFTQSAAASPFTYTPIYGLYKTRRGHDYVCTREEITGGSRFYCTTMLRMMHEMVQYPS